MLGVLKLSHLNLGLLHQRHTLVNINLDLGEAVDLELEVSGVLFKNLNSVALGSHVCPEVKEVLLQLLWALHNLRCQLGARLTQLGQGVCLVGLNTKRKVRKCEKKKKKYKS